MRFSVNAWREASSFEKRCIRDKGNSYLHLIVLPAALSFVAVWLVLDGEVVLGSVVGPTWKYRDINS